MEGLIIATNRPESFRQWWETWKEQAEEGKIQLFAMYDSHNDVEELTDGLDASGMAFNHGAVKEELGDKAWIIPSGTSACKSFAIYQAWKAGCEIIYCMDDDCLPRKYTSNKFFENHRSNLKCMFNNSVFMTMLTTRPRGVPYVESTEIALSHGLWTENMDVDAVTQLAGYMPSMFNVGVIPKGALFTFSGMNWACSRAAMPLMYFGLQGEEWGIDRFDDIWCGFVAKKIMDRLNMGVFVGPPYVRHVKASDPLVNLEKEASGYRWNVDFYNHVMNGMVAYGGDAVDCIRSTGHQITNWAKGKKKGGNKKEGAYFEKYGEAIQVWASLFNEK